MGLSCASRFTAVCALGTLIHTHAAAMDFSSCRQLEPDFVTATQQQIINTLEASRINAIAWAAEQPDPGLKRQVGLLLGNPKVVALSTVAGAYKCRKVMVEPDVIFDYAFFDCKITAGGEGTYLLEKMSGSQRFYGVLEPQMPDFAVDQNKGYLKYTGMYHNADEKPKEWDRNARDSQVGCISAMPNGHLILEMPPQSGFRAHVIWEMKKTG